MTDCVKNSSSEKRTDAVLKKLKEIHIGTYIVFLLVLLFIFIPLYVMLATSVMTDAEAIGTTFHFIPKMGITFDAYKTAFTRETGGPKLIVAFFNSIWIYVPGVLVGAFMSAFCAYAFAKLDFKTKNISFAILMSGLTLPNCLGTISSFLLFDALNWVNTPLPLIVPNMLGSVSVMFFLRQFYMGIPDDLLGAGRVDGLGEFGLFFKIMLPISIPPILSQFILRFIVAYNDYLGPLLYLQNSAFYPMTIAISFFTEAFVQNWPLQMAGCTIAMLPLLLLYLLSQKFILAGVAVTSGLKG